MPLRRVVGAYVHDGTAVRAVGSAGAPGPDPQAPSTPTGLDVIGTTTTSVTIDWDASTPAPGGSLDHYDVYLDGTLVGSTTARQWLFGGLAVDTPYLAGVEAVGGNGAKSERATLPIRTQAAPATPRMLVGAYVGPDTEAQWLAREAMLGRSLGIRRSYISGAIPSSWSSTPAARDVGKRASWLSFKGDLATMRDGGYTSSLTSCLGGVPSSHVLYLTFRHEPENDGIPDPGVYRSALRTFYTVVKAVRPQTIVAQIVYMDWTFDPASGRKPEDWYPGNDYVDVIGFDTYNPYQMPAMGNTNNWHNVPSAAQTAFKNYAASKGKPWAVGEFGCNEDRSGIGPTRKATWIRQFADWAAANNCVAACYFDIYKSGDTNPTILMDSSPQSVDAMRYMIDTYGSA